MIRRLAAVALGLFALLTVLVAARWSPLLRLDGRLARSLVVDRGRWVDGWRVVTDALQPTVWRALALVAAALLCLRRRFGDAVRVVGAVLASLVLGLVLKSAVGRARPPVAVLHVGGLSYPSSHALTAATVATALVLVLVLPAQVRRRSAGAGAPGVAQRLAPGVVLAALLVGLTAVGLTAASRVALGVHYVSDVTGGVLLGVGVAAAAFSLRRVPVGAPGGSD